MSFTPLASVAATFTAKGPFTLRPAAGLDSATEGPVLSMLSKTDADVDVLPAASVTTAASSTGPSGTDVVDHASVTSAF